MYIKLPPTPTPPVPLLIAHSHDFLGHLLITNIKRARMFSFGTPMLIGPLFSPWHQYLPTAAFRIANNANKLTRHPSPPPTFHTASHNPWPTYPTKSPHLVPQVAV